MYFMGKWRIEIKEILMLQIRILCIALKKIKDLSSFYGHETINGEQFCQFNILLSRISFSINLYHRRKKIVKWLYRKEIDVDANDCTICNNNREENYVRTNKIAMNLKSIFSCDLYITAKLLTCNIWCYYYFACSARMNCFEESNKMPWRNLI